MKIMSLFQVWFKVNITFQEKISLRVIMYVYSIISNITNLLYICEINSKRRYFEVYYERCHLFDFVIPVAYMLEFIVLYVYVCFLIIKGFFLNICFIQKN